jgi:nitrite reductase/ring-hydroxylating ferredoxin subunit
MPVAGPRNHRPVACPGNHVEQVPLGDPAGRDRWLVEHGGRSYLVLASDHGYLVTDALCPHKGSPLLGGLVRNGALVCPGHWYAFDLDTGTCRNGAEESMTLHPVVQRDGKFYAEITRAEPVSWSERLRALAQGG